MYSAFGVDHGDFSKSRASEGKAYRKKSNNAAVGSIGGTLAGYTGAHVAMNAHDSKRHHEGNAKWYGDRSKHWKKRGLESMEEGARHIGEYRANPEGHRADKLTWDAKMANKTAVAHLNTAQSYANTAKDSVKSAKKMKNWRTAGLAATGAGFGAGIGLVGRSVHYDQKAKAKGQ